MEPHFKKILKFFYCFVLFCFVLGKRAMLKFIRGKAQQPSADRQKLQRELFAFRKVNFPFLNRVKLKPYIKL